MSALPALARDAVPRMVAARLGALDLSLHPEGGVYIAAEATLVIADLHLEKSAAFAARGQMLPPYETLETLRRVTRLVEELSPARLVLLGDSFHSRIETIGGDTPAHALIEALAKRVELVWIAGNHDPAPPLKLPGREVASLRIGDVLFRHAPMDDGEIEVVGHLHPAGRLETRAGGQRRKCFVHARGRLMLPAFGALTGGLALSDPAIARWLDPEARAFMLCREAGSAVLREVPARALR
jgi:DNA ligase-associated metallophosphoesterase